MEEPFRTRDLVEYVQDPAFDEAAAREALQRRQEIGLVHCRSEGWYVGPGAPSLD